MMQDLDGFDLFSYLLLLRSGSRGGRYVLCEGESDCAVLDPHLADDVETLPGYGKDSVLVAIEHAEKQSLKGVAALIDRDWGKDRRPVSKLAAQTDYYDLDATVFYAGNVCARVVSAFCNRQMVRDFLLANGFSSPIQAVTSLGFPIGILRKLSFLRGWGLRISRIPVSEIMDKGSISVDLSELFRASLKRSKKARVVAQDETWIIDEVRSLMQETKDPEAHCCGHDLTASLAFLMRTYWGAQIGQDTLERTMRSSFSCQDLSSRLFYLRLNQIFPSTPDIFTC